MCFPCAKPRVVRGGQIVSIFSDSTFEMSFTVVLSQGEEGAGAWPHRKMDTCPIFPPGLPPAPPPPSQLTILLETFTGSPLHERSSLNCSRGAGDTQALVNRPRLYLQPPLLAFHPHNTSILVMLTSVPSPSSLDPSHHSVYL